MAAVIQFRNWRVQAEERLSGKEKVIARQAFKGNRSTAAENLILLALKSGHHG